MPPKKSKKKDKKRKKELPADGVVTKDELWDQCISLQEELERVQKQKNQFRHERDNLMVSWDISKSRLEESRARLREKLRQKQEIEKHNQEKSNVVRQQLKHVQLEHHNAISELKMEGAASQCQRQTENTEKELVLQKKRAAQQTALMEKKRNKEKCIKEMILMQNEELIEMRHDSDSILTFKQKAHLDKSQKMSKDYLEFTKIKTEQIEEAIAAKVAISNQEVKRQWDDLKDQAKEMDKKPIA